MTLSININKLKTDIQSKIHGDLEICIENKYQMGPPKYIYPYFLITDNIYLPFAYANKIKIPRPQRSSFPPINLRFQGTLRPEQKIVKKEAIKYLSKTGSVLCSMYCGFGKTAGAINLAIGIKLKTLVIVNKIVLIKQWKESILKFCPQAQVEILKPSSPVGDADFYIVNAQNLEKFGKKFVGIVGTCIVDECHLIMAEHLSRSLQHVYPRYLIGLSATPYRPDGLDILLKHYFGTGKIIRELYKEHTVYKIETQFRPPLEKTIQGRLNWGAILDYQANNEERNSLIIDIVQKFSQRNFLILIKRIRQGKYLLEKLRELGESVTDLIGSKQEFNTQARILIGTCQKVGVGFDHSKLDTLLLATDLEEYFIQYLGRIFRTRDNQPIIFDIVDDNSTLRKHFQTRKKIYKKHGGIIKDFNTLEEK